jgi:hypothetical protein
VRLSSSDFFPVAIRPEVCYTKEVATRRTPVAAFFRFWIAPFCMRAGNIEARRANDQQLG